MKPAQIATILNAVFDEIIGESAVVTEDLSNIVDIGRTITAGTNDISDKDFEAYIGAIIDKVGKTIFNDKVYNGHSLGLLRDGWEFGSILEKIRVDVGDYEETEDWNLADYTPTVFDFTPPEVQAKYFNKKVTFTLKNSTTRKQFRSAFTSADSMNRFFSALENRIKMKQRVAIDGLEQRTLNNFIAEKIKAESNVINLLTEYKAENSSATTTASNWMNDKDFLKFVYRKIGIMRKLLERPSMKYNNDGYTTFTTKDDMRIYALSDFVQAMETTVYSDTFHNEYVKLEGFYELPYWQGSGTDDSFSERSKIDVIPASEGEQTGDTDTRTAVTQTGVVFAMIDKNACAVCNEEPNITSIYNPEANFYNWWYKFDCSYFNDLDENGIVFIIADEETTDDETTGDETTGDETTEET